MKTLKWIADIEVSNVSMIKFVGDFKVISNTPNCISIKCFNANNAVTVHEAFLDDCDEDYKDELRNNLTTEKLVDDSYMKVKLNTKSNFSFDVTYKNGYTVVSIVVVKEMMRIG